MKKIIKYIIALLPVAAFAQQQDHYSMYMQNNFLVNPAEGGTEEFIDIQAGYRTQWNHFSSKGTPNTIFASAHAPIGKHEIKEDSIMPLPFHGIGGALIKDEIGPFSITSLKIAYAYHLPVTTDLILSLGAFGGIKQYGLNKDDLSFSSKDGSNDPVTANLRTAVTPDVSLGIWGYSLKKGYYFGVSTFQLLGSNVNIYKDLASQAKVDNVLKMHHWATAGYKLDLNHKYFLVPSIVAKYVTNAPLTFDFNCKFKYQDKAWLGVSYRLQDAVVAMAGVNIKKIFDVAYAFDFTTSDIRNYSSGTHEVIVGLRLPNHQHHAPPTVFW